MFTNQMNAFLSGMSWSFWSICLLLANLTGFNRFCKMYLSPVTYDRIFSLRSTYRMMIGVGMYQIFIFTCSQIPNFNLIFECDKFSFKFIQAVGTSMIDRLYRMYDLCYLMFNITVMPIWYVLVYAKVKKKVELLNTRI